jgi:hypothetical protein
MKTLALQREDIDEILQHTHWIAAKNGEQKRLLAAKYSGWSMALLMEQLISSKVVVRARSTPKRPAHFSGYQVCATLSTIEIPITEQTQLNLFN